MLSENAVYSDLTDCYKMIMEDSSKKRPMQRARIKNAVQSTPLLPMPAAGQFGGG